MSKKFRSVFTLILSILAVGTFQSVNADWDYSAGGISAANPQDIVITLKSSPMTHPEQACLAVTFARMLSKSNNELNNVTLFVTLDGVQLADKDSAIFSDANMFECTTPWGLTSLKDNLLAYLGSPSNNNYDMVVCPICWKERYGTKAPQYGFIPPPPPDPKSAAIGKMILNADKILDF